MKDIFYRQAITVRFLPPSDHNGDRYKAFCNAGSLTVDRDYSLEANEQIALTAKLLIKKLGWQDHGNWSGGVIKNGDTVFVCSNDSQSIKF